MKGKGHGFFLDDIAPSDYFYVPVVVGDVTTEQLAIKIVSPKTHSIFEAVLQIFI